MGARSGPGPRPARAAAVADHRVHFAGMTRCLVVPLFGLFLATALATQAATAPAVSRCDRWAERPAPLPDPALCLRRTGVARSDTPAKTAQALFAHAESRIAAGRFDQAERALDCADATLGAAADPALRYELVRRRGILDYRRERVPEALARFECALALAEAREDRVAVARDLKNIGSALRRLGDLHGALNSLTRSLEMQRATGEIGGPVLNNIADVYREMKEPTDAMRYYREALAAFRAQGERVEAAHVLESMAKLELDGGEVKQPVVWLQEALRVYRENGDRAYELRVYAGLARAALALGDLSQARGHVASALAVADEHRLPLPSDLQLQAARVEHRSGDSTAAASRIRDALALAPNGDTERLPLLEELAAIQESTGDRAGAIATMRRAQAETLAQARAQHDRQLSWLRTRFETAERDRTIAALEAENRLRRAELRQRTLLLWSAVALMLALAAVSWAWLQRRRQRERLEEAARRVRQEEELARYRREADALAEDRSLLQALLDRREDAVCLLDAEGVVLTVNRAACAMLGAIDAPPQGHTLIDYLADADREALAQALLHMEDSQSHRFALSTRGGVALHARLSQWDRGDGLIVLELAPRIADMAEDSTAVETASDESSTAQDDANASVAADVRDEFRRALVELMLAVVDAWERSTGTTRLDLAEKSRIWRVTVDDGRLRARAMERYLSLSKLPHNPRWRDVLRSAYHVLGHCALEAQTREDLQRRVDAVLAYTRRSALV